VFENNYKIIISKLYGIVKIIITYTFLGGWGLGIGYWAQSPIPNPQSPI